MCWRIAAPVLAAVFLWPLLVSAAALPPPGVDTLQGRLRGSLDRGAEVFQGVPFAAAPVGLLRWAPPQDPSGWAGVRDATRPGSACPQPGPPGGLGGAVPSENEDCLFLNIWRPAGTRASDKLPVLIWFHGGGMVFSAAHLYRASQLVTHGRPIIVVTANYRLGIFGFFAHPALEAEHPEVGSGNYGLLDQQQALRWVRANIASFGGDPGRLTIAGESGGAQSVCLLMASPMAKGLFQRAITQSGPCQFKFPLETEAAALGRASATRMGCGQEGPAALACLRMLPVRRVLANMIPGAGAAGNSPVVGGPVLPFNIRAAIAFGRFNAVPTMQGATEVEADYHFIPELAGRRTADTATSYSERLRAAFGELAPTVQKEYPATAYPTVTSALAAAISDSGVTHRIGACNTLLADRLLAPATTVFAYEFADPAAPLPFEIFRTAGVSARGAGHTSELAYLWDSDAALTPAQRALSLTMIRYWTNFVATGDPNGPGLPKWTPFEPGMERVQSLAPGAVKTLTEFSRDHHCDFWASLGFNTLYSYSPSH